VARGVDPLLDLFLELLLNQETGDLITQLRGDLLEFGELGAPGQSLGIDLLTKFSRDGIQSCLNRIREESLVAAHVRIPAQFVKPEALLCQTCIQSIVTTRLTTNTMSCATYSYGGSGWS
jgi:hypothetical protein